MGRRIRREQTEEGVRIPGEEKRVRSCTAKESRENFAEAREAPGKRPKVNLIG